MGALVGVSLVLFAVRLLAASRVGFGDSEALYASYALHPQPSYLDHPGLVGVALRAVGGGSAPTPQAAHLVTALLSTAFPFVMAGAARLAGAGPRGAWTAALTLAVVPELAVGLFGFTPDLLLAFAWAISVGLFAFACRSSTGALGASFAFLGAGLFVGVATASKVSGVVLGLAYVATLAAPTLRGHRRTVWPWAGLLAGAIVALPVVVAEMRAGYPMLRHRLVSTQAGAGFSLRNVGAVLGGQLVYLSPLFAVAAVFVAKDLLGRRRSTDVVDTLLVRLFVVALALLLPLCLWSPVAEPHWLAVAWLVLPLHFARSFDEDDAVVSRRLARAAWALAAGLTILVYTWVLVPGAVRLLPSSADPRFDIANELYGWPEALTAVREEVRDVCGDACAPGDLYVVGPHWIVCGQLEAALGREGGAAVGCATPIPDDFDTWLPRERWQKARFLVVVSDNRFPDGAIAVSPDHALLRSRDVTVERGGRLARRFRIVVLGRSVPS